VEIAPSHSSAPRADKSAVRWRSSWVFVRFVVSFNRIHFCVEFVCTMSHFSASEDESIKLGHCHPIVWNITEKQYKNVVKKDVIWKEIGKMLKKIW
jgi:hypothetical protein